MWILFSSANVELLKTQWQPLAIVKKYDDTLINGFTGSLVRDNLFFWSYSYCIPIMLNVSFKHYEIRHILAGDSTTLNQKGTNAFYLDDNFGHM